MPITRHGYATTRRNGSTRAYRKARAHTLTGATHCHICGKPPTPHDPLVADHIHPVAWDGNNHPNNLRPAHQSCNARRGAPPPPKNL